MECTVFFFLFIATKEQLKDQISTARVRITKVYDTSIEDSTEDEDDHELQLLTRQKVG